MNKTVKKYLIQLLIIGILGVLIGAFLIILLIRDNETNSIAYFPFTTLGIILAYWVVIWGDPGGVVNFYFDARKRTPDEQTLYSLVIKHRSKLLISLVIIIAFIAISTPEILINKPPHVDPNIIVFLIFWPLLPVFVLGTGIKYVSAWWNIRKNLK